MPIRHAVWKVAAQPQALDEVSLAKEQQLEEMIIADPRILSDQWMLIGRQEETGQAGRVDLLAIAPDASLVLIELKRNRTPRDVVSQAVDYASWLEKVTPDRVAAIYDRFSSGRSLSDDFKKRFGLDLEDDSINQSHQIIIVASSLDDSTERIVQYLRRWWRLVHEDAAVVESRRSHLGKSARQWLRWCWSRNEPGPTLQYVHDPNRYRRKTSARCIEAGTLPPRHDHGFRPLRVLRGHQVAANCASDRCVLRSRTVWKSEYGVQTNQT